MEFEFEKVKRPDVTIRLTSEEADQLAAAIMFYTATIPRAIIGNGVDSGVIAPSGTSESICEFMRKFHHNLTFNRDYGSKGVRHFIPSQS